MNDASGGKIEVENKKIKVFFLFEHLLHKNRTDTHIGLVFSSHFLDS
jgi:hypothetical protein